MSGVLRRENDRSRHADSPKAAAQGETQAATTEHLLVARVASLSPFGARDLLSR
jgi:hypothetical protein